MAAPACPSCGNINPPGTEKCLKCGATLPMQSRTVTCPKCGNINAIGSVQCVKCGAELPLTYIQPIVVNQKTEKAGIGALKLTGILLLLGGIMIWVFPIVVWAAFGYQHYTISIPPTNSDVLPPVSSSFYYALMGVLGAGVVLLAVAWYMFSRAFFALSTVDLSFRIAGVSALIGITSAILAGAAIGVDVDAIYNYLQCAGGVTPIPATCTISQTTAYTIYWLWAFSIMFLIFGGIGVLIGLFRVGARYLSPSFWLAGFLLIFPILVVIGALVLLMGSVGAEKRLMSWKESVPSEPAKTAKPS